MAVSDRNGTGVHVYGYDDISRIRLARSLL
jgi:hypothetical protein